ncbi:small subunit ribosomal protein S8e [Pancytospora epiphaga]|nr:small subunit ribosomal protein S8e [Pancytospora epiphaga]
MGITTCGRNKRTKTGGQLAQFKKKRKNTMGRQPSNTKIGEERVKDVRVRGGNIKRRALRLNIGTFTLLSTGFSAPTSISTVLYHPSCNELMRTNTLTKGSVVRVDAKPFIEEVSKVDKCKSDKSLQSLLEKETAFAILTSRPGQCGKAEGYILQGAELEFFQNKINKQKKVVQ